MRRAAVVIVPAEEGRPDQTVLTDLSANVFAALLLILLMLMQFEATPRQPTASGPAQVTRSRAPLGAGALVDLLYARGADADLSVDLGDAGLVLAPGPAAGLGRAEGLQALGRRLDTDAGRPLHVYVFANRHYAALAASLDARHQPWTELSVPQALRDPARPDRWSPAFLALARTRDLTLFRAGLAELLAGAPADRPDGHVAARGQGSASNAGAATASAEPASLLDRLLQWLHVIGIIAVLGLGLGAVAAIERLVPARRLG